MQSIDISKHTLYSLEFIFNESDKFFTDVLKAISENINKSFLLLAFYFTIVSVSFYKIIDDSNFLYLVLLGGSLIGLLILSKNIFPNSIHFKGSLPEKLINDYFDEYNSEELNKEYLATQIQSYNLAILKNFALIETMMRNFTISIYVVAGTFLIFIFIYFIDKSLCF